MVSHARDGYTFVNEGRVGGVEEINYIIASGGHAHHLFQVAVKGNLRNSNDILLGY